MNATIDQLRRDHAVDATGTPFHIPPYRMGHALVRAQSLLGFVAQVVRAGVALAMTHFLIVAAHSGMWYAVIPVVYFALSLVAPQIARLKAPALMVSDCLFALFFVNLTGGIASPYLLLMVALVPLAMLSDGLRGSVMAACLGLLAVLVSGVVALPTVSSTLPIALLSLFVCGVACGWLSAMAERLLQYICTGVQSGLGSMPRPAQTKHHPEWAGDVEQLLKISDAHQLLHAAKQYARGIANCPVDIQVGTMRMGSVGSEATRIVCEAARQRVVLTVHTPPATLAAPLTAHLRVIGHIVARQWNVPMQIVEAVDVTPTTPILASVSTCDTLDIAGIENAMAIIEETATPTTPLQRMVLTAMLPDPGEIPAKRRTRANADQSQLDLWI